MRRRTRSRSPVRSETASLTVPLGHFADGCDDVGIGGAPADVAAHPFGDFGIGQGRSGCDIRRRVARPACLVFGEERDGRTNLAGRAVPALESIMAYESGLHGMQRALLCQTFDGGDLVAVMHHRECQAAIDALSIDDDRAGAALSLVAALLRTGQREMLSQSIEQRGPRIEVQGIVLPVDREPYVLARQRSSLRRRLAHRGWRRERQSCGPGGLEEAAPGRHGSKLEQTVHNTASVCVRVQMEGLPALGSQLSKSIEPPDRRSCHRREEAIQAGTRSRRKECISHSPARDKMTMQTGMYAVQKTEKNMSRHLSMSVGALDRERCCRRANLELAAAHWRARHRSESPSSDHRPRSLL